MLLTTLMTTIAVILLLMAMMIVMLVVMLVVMLMATTIIAIVIIIVIATSDHHRGEVGADHGARSGAINFQRKVRKKDRLFTLSSVTSFNVRHCPSRSFNARLILSRLALSLELS